MKDYKDYKDWKAISEKFEELAAYSSSTLRGLYPLLKAESKEVIQSILERLESEIATLEQGSKDQSGKSVEMKEKIIEILKSRVQNLIISDLVSPFFWEDFADEIIQLKEEQKRKEQPGKRAEVDQFMLDWLDLDEHDFDKARKQLYNILASQQGTKAVSDGDVHYLTIYEVAEKLKISLVTLHKWTKSGTLKSYKKGYRVLYDASEIAKITHTKFGRPIK